LSEGFHECRVAGPGERWLDREMVPGEIPRDRPPAQERERSAEMEDGQQSLRGLDAA